MPIVAESPPLVYGGSPTPPPSTEKAIWHIGQAADPYGSAISSAKIYVDGVYIGHYTPEDIKFCSGCACDTFVSCGFGSHTVTVKATGHVDWSKTRTVAIGDSFSDDPILLILSSPSPVPSPVPTTTPPAPVSSFVSRHSEFIDRVDILPSCFARGEFADFTDAEFLDHSQIAIKDKYIAQDKDTFCSMQAVRTLTKALMRLGEE